MEAIGHWKNEHRINSKMLLYYKLHRVKKLVDATTDEICKYLRHFNGSEQLSLELNHEHILKIRNYVLGDYLNTSVSFFRLYSDRKLLDKTRLPYELINKIKRLV